MSSPLCFDKLLSKVNAQVKQLSLQKEPTRLYEPISYVLSLGGKRIRPVLLLMAANLYNDRTEVAMPAALAIEVFHNFTLLHDDIMDKAEMRRGKPTVHNVWNANAAILSGDAMQIYSYQLLGMLNPEEFLKVYPLFCRTAIEVCEGQQYDMDFETRQDVAAEEYLEMIRLKTAVMIAGALKMGALIGGATNEEADKLYAFGINIGLAFQLKDDLLDVYGDPKVFGKNIGGDIISNKKTYLLIKALELANPLQKRQLERWIAKAEFDPAQKIEAVKEIYAQLGVEQLCEAKTEQYFSEAMAVLQSLGLPSDKTEPLAGVAKDLMTRNL